MSSVIKCYVPGNLFSPLVFLRGQDRDTEQVHPGRLTGRVPGSVANSQVLSRLSPLIQLPKLYRFSDAEKYFSPSPGHNE